MWFTLLALQYDIFVLIFFGTAYTRLRKNNDKNQLTETKYKIVCKGIKPPLISLFCQKTENVVCTTQFSSNWRPLFFDTA